MHEGALSLTTLLAVGIAALVPILLVGATSFAKIAVVFSVLRNALGAPDVPSGAVVTALAVILSASVMAPVAQDALARSEGALSRVDTRDPLAASASRAALVEAARRASEAWSAFLAKNCGDKERDLFLELANRGSTARRAQRDSLSVVLPAFLMTELKEAFQIGVLLLLPFVVLDLVVGSVLGAVGMPLLSPGAIALPLKLLLFVAVDGWTALSRALLTGYHY